MVDRSKLILEEITKLYGDVLAVDQVTLRVPEGQFVSLLGPSGCGKTTTLRTIAGLERPDAGRIVVDGQVLSDAHTVTPPERRGMGMVFQSYAVWPHMTVWENVAYGLKCKGVSRDRAKSRVSTLLDLVGLSQYAHRYPSQLSGGQQQRVALARALATEPSILLLDEPLSNLDALLRESMRFEIRSLQQRLGITTIYVTHAQDEALAVSDEVVVMSEGRIVQHGPPEEVYGRPQTRFVAGFIGLANFITVRPAGEDGAYLVLELPSAVRIRVLTPKRNGPPDEPAVLMVRPENLKLATEATRVSPVNQLQATVENVSFTGNIVNYFVTLNGLAEPLRVQSTPPVCVHKGEQVGITFAPEDCVLLTA